MLILREIDHIYFDRNWDEAMCVITLGKKQFSFGYEDIDGSNKNENIRKLNGKEYLLVNLNWPIFKSEFGSKKQEKK